MSKILDLSTAEIKKLQYDILYSTTANNGYLEYNDIEYLNKALITANKRIIIAINEIFTQAIVTVNTVDQFRNRFNEIMGNEIAVPILKTNLLQVGDNVQDAIFKLYTRLLGIEEAMNSMGGFDAVEIEHKIELLEAKFSNLLGMAKLKSFKEKTNPVNNKLFIQNYPINVQSIIININGLSYFGINNDAFKLNSDNTKIIEWQFTSTNNGFDLEESDCIYTEYNAIIE